MHLSYRSDVICSNERRKEKKAAGNGTRVLKSIASLSRGEKEKTRANSII